MGTRWRDDFHAPLEEDERKPLGQCFSTSQESHELPGDEEDHCCDVLLGIKSNGKVNIDFANGADTINKEKVASQTSSTLPFTQQQHKLHRRDARSSFLNFGKSTFSDTTLHERIRSSL